MLSTVLQTLQMDYSGITAKKKTPVCFPYKGQTGDLLFGLSNTAAAIHLLLRQKDQLMELWT